MADKKTSSADKVFDPFAADPAIVAMGPAGAETSNNEKSASFNPDVSPFTPVSELGTWKIIAAEYTGKAVAVMQTTDNKLYVCTSPSFNSKCRHPTVPCLDWDNVKIAPGHGSQPDSGLDNTDQSSEDREKIARVAQWSAEAARHAEEGEYDDQNGVSEWENVTFQTPAPEWTDHQSPMWSGPGGETHLVQWSPVSVDHGQHGQQGPLSPASYNNLQITVEYHQPQHQDHFSPTLGAEYAGGGVSEVADTESTSTVMPGRGGYGNDPLFVCQDQSWDSTMVTAPSTDDSWAMGMGMDLSRLSLTDYSRDSASLMNNINSHVDKVEQERKRNEFKQTVLTKVGLVKEPSEEDKIRENFKKQILSNLDKKDLAPSTPPPSKDDLIRDEFKQQIINNLNR